LITDDSFSVGEILFDLLVEMAQSQKMLDTDDSFSVGEILFELLVEMAQA